MATFKSKSGKPRIPPLKIENGRIVYRNFAGAAKKFNVAGERNFHVVLEPDLAKRLQADGWNVKWPKPRDDGEERSPTLKVKVRFDNYPPLIVLMTSKTRTELTEDTVGLLDNAEIDQVHMRITGSYNETDTGWKGFTAYLSQMFVELSPTDLMGKYAAIPSGQRPSDDD